jgi:phage tail-like protein
VRGLLPGLETALPLVEQLPAVYQEDEFTRRFLSAFDAVLAPVVATLDDLSAYVDPALAPPDLLPWLAGWVAVSLAPGSAVEQQRALVQGAVALHRRRGTVSGVVEAVRLAVGHQAEVQVEDSGAASWSRTPSGDLPGSAPAAVVVRVRVEEPTDVDLSRLQSLIRSLVPAHVAVSLEVTRGDGPA